MENLNNPLEKSTSIKCDKCGSELFMPVTILRKISKLMIGAPEDAIIHINTFACLECHHVNKDLLPKLPSEEPKTSNIKLV